MLGKENIIGLILQMRERHRKNKYRNNVGHGGRGGTRTQVDSLLYSFWKTLPHSTP